MIFRFHVNLPGCNNPNFGTGCLHFHTFSMAHHFRYLFFYLLKMEGATSCDLGGSKGDSLDLFLDAVEVLCKQ